MAMSWKAIRKMLDRDSLLRQVGLEDRTPGSDFLNGLGLFSVGVLVGAGLGLLFAPRRGEDVRAWMTGQWRGRAGKLADVAQQMGAEAGMPPSSGMGQH